MNRDRLVQLAYDRQAEMRHVARQNHRLAQSSQERASRLRSREHEERRRRASLQLRQAE